MLIISMYNYEGKHWHLFWRILGISKNKILALFLTPYDKYSISILVSPNTKAVG